jgi:hypothetical protein
MTCDVDNNATITAVSTFKNGNVTPPAFQCRPKMSATDFSGYWVVETDEVVSTAFSNRYGRTDVEGCCWWGRGILMTRGTCSFGRINHYLGVNAVSMGYVNFYDVDFCIYPEVVCNSPYSKDLRWAVGYVEWIDQVQTYNGTSNYMDELDDLVISRFNQTNIDRFIDIVGWALTLSCSEASWRCDSSIDRKLIIERRDNFMMLLDVLDLYNLLPDEATTTLPAITSTLTYNDDATTDINGTTTDTVSTTTYSGGSDNMDETDNDSIIQTEFWYPLLTEDFEEGICIDLLPIPSNASLYQSELECCVKFFNEQVEGKCLNEMKITSSPNDSMPIESLPRNPSKKPTPQPDPPSRRPTEDPTYQPSELILLPSCAVQRKYCFTGLILLSVWVV